MRRSVFVFAAVLVLIAATPLSVVGEGTKSWTVFDYNPSGNALAPRVSPDSMPATSSCGSIACNGSFVFKPGVFTALLVTSDDGLTGDLTGGTLSATVAVSGNAGPAFQYQNGDGCTYPPNVRMYFTSAVSSGPSSPPPGPPQNGLPPAGFYTQFWWSNPVNVQLLDGTESGTLMVPLTPGNWSDWDGKNSASLPEAFAEAVANVKSIGFSFGGGCFFENGVTTTSSSAETLTFTFSKNP